MKQQDILSALKDLKANSPKRNFKQTIDLIISLRNLDLKKPENQVDVYATLHYGTGRKHKICALVGGELLPSAKEACDFFILADDFPRWTDKKQMKKLAREYDYFIAQANIMPKVAQTFGKFLGVAGKMPNPKAGCVVPPNANLKALVERLQKTVRVSAKKQPNIQTVVGLEDSDENEVSDNVMSIYNNLLHALPNEFNIKAVYLKFTMGPAIKVGAKQAEEVKAGKKARSILKGKADAESQDKIEEADPVKKAEERPQAAAKVRSEPKAEKKTKAEKKSQSKVKKDE